MDLQPVPFRSLSRRDERQAESLLAATVPPIPRPSICSTASTPASSTRRSNGGRSSSPTPKSATPRFRIDDARLAIARYYDFLDLALTRCLRRGVSQEGPVFEFESAVEAVVNGDLAALEDALRRDPALVRARSSRVCCFDPPVHRATLLHYVAANGVEAYRQKTPPNAVEIARALLQAGAEPDALADMYGAECTTMSMLVSSSHPAKAGLQVALVELLLDFGAAIEGRGTRKWGRPLFTALAFGMIDAAKVLAETRGVDRSTRRRRTGPRGRCRPPAPVRGCRSAPSRALAGGAARHAEIVRLLLDAGEDPNRYNLEGNHAHSTPLHQAVLGATRRWCGSWSSAARGWISGIPSGRARRSVGRFMAAATRSRDGRVSAVARRRHSASASVRSGTEPLAMRESPRVRPRPEQARRETPGSWHRSALEFRCAASRCPSRSGRSPRRPRGQPDEPNSAGQTYWFEPDVDLTRSRHFLNISLKRAKASASWAATT